MAMIYIEKSMFKITSSNTSHISNSSSKSTNTVVCGAFKQEKPRLLTGSNGIDKAQQGVLSEFFQLEIFYMRWYTA